MAEILGLYAGALRALEPEGQATGIYKQPITQADVTETGIVGDHQADRRMHGGEDKALHQFALASYDTIVGQYPQLDGIAVPGAFGENLSSAEFDDQNVCIGDTYRIGSIVVQVSQPRRPCWKINHRFDCRELSMFVERRRITGWYYRVIEGGHVAVGDPMTLTERCNEDVSIATFTDVISQHRPHPDMLDKLIHAANLNADWRHRLVQRRDYLATRSGNAR